jgi:hypothetical protein
VEGELGDTALVMTMHDPEGRLRPGLDAVGERLTAYDGVYAVATDSTDASLIAEVRRRGVEVAIGPVRVPGTGQRMALATAFAAGHEHLFVCDFDRWLHWAATFPDELDDLRRRMGEEFGEAWYVCLGRTARAHATHPMTQVLAETATNRALSAVLGRTVDATAGASWIRREAARLIVDQAIETSKATDLEWPGLVLRVDPARVWGCFVEGLEFETADAYREEIAAAGSREAWIAAVYDQPGVMRERLQLAADSIGALMRVVE